MVRSEIRWCADLDLFVLDRPRILSCRHATPFCWEGCYNIGLEKRSKHLPLKDAFAEHFWQACTPADFVRDLGNKRRATDRFRFGTRGEFGSTLADVDRLAGILAAMPQTLFWIPTRGWRDAAIRTAIEAKLHPLANARVQASLDPSNTVAEGESLRAAGWSTMYFGDDGETAGRFLCPKTHTKAKAICSTCAGGCFAAGQNHIHLKQH